MRFWDTSALLPLMVQEPTTAHVRELYEADPDAVVWWSTGVECASGIARLRREGVITVAEENATLELLDTLRSTWLEILPGEAVRERAVRLLRVHPLRAAHAMQLAAAMEWRDGTASKDFVTYDERLAHAARLEGFRIPL